jgi:putative oxidoreductase
MDMAKAGSSFESYALALLRIVAGFTFTLHGAQKFGALGGLRGHAATAFTMLWFGGVLEIIGGPLIILGLFTRPVAFILCGEMAVAYFTVHVHMGPWLFPLLNNGEITVLYCFLFLYMVTVGPGALSLDGAIRKR